jgi:predicted phosphodiesterase
MRIGFFSDVHANYEALAACLQDFEKEGLNKLFFIGDAVGYGADPNLVVEKISEICEILLLGNHDAAAIGELSPEYFNEYARAAFYYTHKTLNPQNYKTLKQFQINAGWDNFTMVHALPKDPESWGYITSLREAEENFRYFDTQVCLIGHSHRPFVAEKEDNQKAVLRNTESVVLDPNCRYIINVGSVGQPRDGNPNACYVIYNTDNSEIIFRRVKYDIDKAQDKMRNARIPGYLIDRLSVGR